MQVRLNPQLERRAIENETEQHHHKYGKQEQCPGELKQMGLQETIASTAFEANQAGSEKGLQVFFERRRVLLKLK